MPKSSKIRDFLIYRPIRAGFEVLEAARRSASRDIDGSDVLCILKPKSSKIRNSVIYRPIRVWFEIFEPARRSATRGGEIFEVPPPETGFRYQSGQNVGFSRNRARGGARSSVTME